MTGAGGFIGSHLVEALVRQGWQVRCFVRYNSMGSKGWLDVADAVVRDNVEIVAGDIRDPHGVAVAVSGCTVVFHLAALIGIPYSYRSPGSYVETNVNGTLNVLEAARLAQVERFVHTSTSEVYGSAQFVPITEQHPLIGQSPYSASKIGADQLALSYYYSFNTPVVVLRPFNTYGPRQSTRAVIPTVISQVAAGSRTLSLGSVSPTRDFNYVKDTVRGFIAGACSENAVGHVVNIGSGYEVSIRDAVRLIADVMEVEVEIDSDEKRMRPRDSEVLRLCAANDKARKLLGWQPEYAGPSGLRRGISETVDWFNVPANLSNYRTGEYAV